MQPPPPAQLSRRCRTDGFAAYSVAYSPFFPNKLAVAGSANFGLVGNGRLNIIGVGPSAMGVDKAFDTQDGLYDLAWSEVHENQLVTASGDGSVKLWDIMLNDFPIRKWHEHAREVFSIDWSNVQKELFCTGSWDCSVKIWTPDRTTSIGTIPAHTACVYSALFSPSQPATIATCSSDGFLKVWDTRTAIRPAGPGQLAQPSIALAAHSTEVLSLDWNKYQPHLIATGSVDRTIRVHDLRMCTSSPQGASPAPTMQPNATVASLLGHEYAVRKVAWSPHSADIIASASYDMTARVWGIDTANAGGPAPQSQFGSAGMGQGARLLRIHQDHTEFVVGLAWSFFEDGVVASCSWDQEVHLWR
ncbi:WD40 repeat-like protein [Meredithblackwellia eburnea MCA 4105]